MNMSFSEKSAWISLVTTVCVFGYYFARVLGFADLPQEQGATEAAKLLGSLLVVVIIIESIFHSMLAATNHRAAEMGADERDRLFALKANQVGYTILSVGAVFVIGRLILVELEPSFADHNSSLQLPMLTAHLLMGSFILSEIARFAMQIVYYRRGY